VSTAIKIKNTNAYMKSYAKRLVQLLKKEMDTPQAGREAYDNPKITATGKGKNSIQMKVASRSLTSLGIEIVGEDYLLKVDKGTRSANVEDIAKWIVAKPVTYETRRFALKLTDVNDPTTRRLASNIVKKINSEGTEPTNFIKRTVESQLKNLKVDVAVVEDVRENVVDILKAAGFDMSGKTVKFS
jgi:hypothetical protein